MTAVPDAPELAAFGEAVRAQAERRLAPLADPIDRSQAFSPELWSAVRELELFGLPFPAAVGGADGTFLAFIVATEEVARSCAVAALYPGTTVQVATALLENASEELIAACVPRLVRGEALAAWAFTEPQTGSDPRQLETRATRVDGGWLLRGQKLFISFAGQAAEALVFARTGDASVGAFLVDTADPGWQVGTKAEVMAFGGTEAAAVFLEDIVVPDGRVVGSPTGGFDVLLGGEARGKVRAAAICVGIAQRALEEAAAYAMQRTHRGTPIAERFDTITAHLGEMHAQVLGARALVRASAAAVDRGEDVAAEAAACRIVAGRAGREVANAAMQVCGAYGMTRELVVERLYREAKFFEVTQGATEIQRVIAGKAALRRYARPG